MRGKWRTIDGGWRQRGVAFLREVLPLDFDDSYPIYLVSDGETPDHFPRDDGMIAGTSALMDLSLKPVLGDWRGRGFACTVFCDRIGSEEQLMAGLLHEACHHVCALAALSAMGENALTLMTHSPSNMPDSTRAIATQKVGTFREVLDSDIMPWEGHAADFVYACCHAGWRGWQRADLCGSWAMMHFAGDRYSLSHHHHFLAACGDTLQEFEHLPLVAVVAGGPPQPFSDLFDQDVRNYHDARSMQPVN